MTQLPKIFQLRDLCAAGYLPCNPRSIQNNARPIGGGAYQAQLGGLNGQPLRLVKIGSRFAVVEQDLIDFLQRSGVAIPREGEPARGMVAQPPTSGPRRGRPRGSSERVHGGAL